MKMIKLQNNYAITSSGCSFALVTFVQVKKAIEDLKREIKGYE